MSSLDRMPEEIFILILSTLSPHDLVATCRVSWKLHRLATPLLYRSIDLAHRVRTDHPAVEDSINREAMRIVLRFCRTLTGNPLLQSIPTYLSIVGHVAYLFIRFQHDLINNSLVTNSVVLSNLSVLSLSDIPSNGPQMVNLRSLLRMTPNVSTLSLSLLHDSYPLFSFKNAARGSPFVDCSSLYTALLSLSTTLRSLKLSVNYIDRLCRDAGGSFETGEPWGIKSCLGPLSRPTSSSSSEFCNLEVLEVPIWMLFGWSTDILAAVEYDKDLEENGPRQSMDLVETGYLPASLTTLDLGFDLDISPSLMTYQWLSAEHYELCEGIFRWLEKSRGTEESYWQRGTLRKGEGLRFLKIAIRSTRGSVPAAHWDELGKKFRGVGVDFHVLDIQTAQDP